MQTTTIYTAVELADYLRNLRRQGLTYTVHETPAGDGWTVTLDAVW